jgi:hypothetical protein
LHGYLVEGRESGKIYFGFVYFISNPFEVCGMWSKLHHQGTLTSKYEHLRKALPSFHHKASDINFCAVFSDFAMETSLSFVSKDLLVTKSNNFSFRSAFLNV